jgi:cation transport regulator
MPYARNAELPETVRAALPEAAQSVFRNVFNEREASGDSEQASIRQAWGAVKNGWEKRDGKWVRKVAKAEYQGRQVELDKPFRLPSGSSKKFGVYVKDGDSVKRVTFGDPDMEIRRDDDEARANFRARHSCDTKTDKTTPGYWSCRP